MIYFIFLVSLALVTCYVCHGRGQEIKDPCQTCHGTGQEKQAQSVHVKIQAGVETGQRCVRDVRSAGRMADKAVP